MRMSRPTHKGAPDRTRVRLPAPPSPGDNMPRRAVEGDQRRLLERISRQRTKGGDARRDAQALEDMRRQVPTKPRRDK